jgi:annexin A7/11
VVSAALVFSVPRRGALTRRLEYSLVLLSRGPLLGDVHLIDRACRGAGTHEDLLNEVLLCRTNEEIRILKYMYKKVFNKDLDKTVRGELSMKTER